MKSFIIYLPAFKNSVKWAIKAQQSALQHSWEVELYEGFDGRYSDLKEHDIFMNPHAGTHKGEKLLGKPGVIGCFLSHYFLWKKSLELNEPICILEHDVTIHKLMPDVKFLDVIKLVSGPKGKQKVYGGTWWAGAMAYCITPQGANKLVKFVNTEGALPADWMLCTSIIDLKFDNSNSVSYVTDSFKFTRDLK
jgi:GR25 family glycosyltransferase involved in LPS biosynthesis